MNPKNEDVQNPTDIFGDTPEFPKIACPGICIHLMQNPRLNI